MYATAPRCLQLDKAYPSKASDASLIRHRNTLPNGSSMVGCFFCFVFGHGKCNNFLDLAVFMPRNRKIHSISSWRGAISISYCSMKYLRAYWILIQQNYMHLIHIARLKLKAVLACMLTRIGNNSDTCMHKDLQCFTHANRRKIDCTVLYGKMHFVK